MVSRSSETSRSIGTVSTRTRLIAAASTLLDRATAGPRRACLWLGAIALALFLPGFFTLPPMDRDEPRFAQASKQMIETGDAVAIRFQAEARNKKPVGIYWLQASVVKIAECLGFSDARRTIWLYRLPSLAGAVAAVLLTFWTALAFAGPRTAFIAALLFASTVMIGVEARLAKTDAVLAATVVAAMGAFARVYLAERDQAGGRPAGLGPPFIFWTAIAIGILVKGPVTPMVPLLAGLALAFGDRGRSQRFWRFLVALRPGVGIAWCLLIVAPWFILILIKTGGSFFADSLGKDMLGKVASGQELHGAPPGSYLLAFFISAWPLAPLAVLAAPFAWRARREPAVAVLLAWIVPAWIVFELIPTKLPHYVLPLYPAIAIVAALAWQSGGLAGGSLWRKRVLALLPIVPVAVTTAAIIVAHIYGSDLGWRFTLGAPVVIAIAAVVWRAWTSRVAGAAGPAALEAPLLGLAVLAFGLEALVFQGLISGPFFEPFALSPRLVAASEVARQAGTCPRLSLATVSDREPSLVFLTSTDLLMTDALGAAAFLGRGPCRAAFVGAGDEAAFRAALPAGAPARLASRVGGVNLNGGKRLDIGVYVRQGEGP
jgi:4-amino-4-deoxy-L-arabinose transferase-like glycosyltransferase